MFEVGELRQLDQNHSAPARSSRGQAEAAGKLISSNWKADQVRQRILTPPSFYLQLTQNNFLADSTRSVFSFFRDVKDQFLSLSGFDCGNKRRAADVNQQILRIAVMSSPLDPETHSVHLSTDENTFRAVSAPHRVKRPYNQHYSTTQNTTRILQDKLVHVNPELQTISARLEGAHEMHDVPQKCVE